MGSVAISYSSLKNASSEAKAVARKIDNYADSLHTNVYKKLDRYDGNWSGNLTTAKSKVNAKINELRREEKNYKDYANDLIDLRDECKSVDKAVRTSVSKLTASFKKANGIRNSKIENAIGYLLTSVDNKTKVGRWISDRKGEADAARDYIKSRIKEWYNYDGGKELIKGIAGVVFDVAIAIAGAVAAAAVFLAGALTAGAVLVLAAAFIAAGIALLDAWANGHNELAAYRARKNGDPATGARRSDINSYSDYLRSSYMFGDDGENYRYDKTLNAVANGVDITNTICGVITLVSSVGSLLKNGFKWATGNTKANFKQIFSKQGLSDVFKGAKGKASTNWRNFKEAFKMQDFKYFKEIATDFGSDFLKNLNGKYCNFKGANSYKAVKNGATSIRNLLTLEKTILVDGITGKDVLTKIVFPGTGIVHVPTENAGEHNMITVENIYNPIKKGMDFATSNLFDKLSFRSDIVVSVPEIKVPEFKFAARG